MGSVNSLALRVKRFSFRVSVLIGPCVHDDYSVRDTLPLFRDLIIRESESRNPKPLNLNPRTLKKKVF